MKNSEQGQHVSEAPPLGDPGSQAAQAAAFGARPMPEGKAPVEMGAAWHPALRWVGLVLAVVGVGLVIFGLGRPDLAGCEGVINGGYGPDWDPSATHVTACGELVYEGSEDAAEEYLRRAESGVAAWPFTVGAAVLLGTGVALIAIGNLGAPARRRVSAAGRVALAVAGAPLGLAAGILAVVLFRVMYLAGWLGYGNEVDSFVIPLLLIPAYVILGVAFGAVYRPVAHGSAVHAPTARQPSEPGTAANR